MKRRRKEPPIGSISHGTMRSEDLIASFTWELRRLRGAVPKSIHNAIRALKRGEDGDLLPESEEEASEIVNELFDALDVYSPPYFYFGAHPGDGADYGFWLSEEWRRQAEDDEALFVDDTSKVPKHFRGEVFHINDHGNVTMYVATSRGLREVWAIV